MTGLFHHVDVRRTLWKILFGTGFFGCGIAYSEPVEQLLNSGFDGAFYAVANTNSSGIIRGVFPANWLDNSRYPGKHTDNLYACEANDTVSGNAFRITAALQSGYSSGVNVELYQPFAAVSQRIYTASVWLKCSSNAVAQLVIRQKSSPYSARAATNCVITSTWQSFHITVQSVATETLAVSVNLSNHATTLWVDQASCVVQDGGRVWYVAPNGADSNSGSLSAPFETVARAVTQLNVGDVITLRAGTYRETLQLPLSGTRENPITFCAYNNEPVIVSGCDVVAGPWAATSNAIYTARAEWTLGSGYNQVFVDGAMVHEARHPNFGSTDLLRPATAALTVFSNYTVAASAFDGLGDLTGARFYASVGSSWAWQNALIASNTTGTIFLNSASASTWWWPNYGNKSSDTGKGFVYGLLRLLDADGEWFVQSNAAAPHTLHLRIAEGVDPAEHVVEMKRRNWCVDFNGQNFIVVSNVAFTAGAVRLNGEGLVLTHCTAEHLSHFMVFSSGGTANGGRTEGSGISVSGTNNNVEYCTVHDTAGSGILVNGTGHRITRNHVYNTDYSATYAVCLKLDGMFNTATFNTLHDTGRDIVQPTGKGCTLMFNECYSAGRLCKDLGAVYAWGTNAQATNGALTRIAYNWVHDSSANDPLGMGIYIDNYSRHFQIDHNVVWNFGDLATKTWSDGMRLNAPGDDLRVFHNTLFRCRSYNYGTFTPYLITNSTPDNTYWTTNNHHLFSIAQNNLHMTNAPTELENGEACDFRLKAASWAVDPLFVTNTIAWITTNGVVNVPASYHLAMSRRNQFFAYEEQAGQGVPVDLNGDGLPEPFMGSAPDSGAYERGDPYWAPGIWGWLPEQAGVRSEEPYEYVGDIVTAKATLLSCGHAPATLFICWGEGSDAAAWTNTVCLATALTNSFQTVFYNLSNIRLYTTYGYRFAITNAYGATWSEPMIFTTGSGLPMSMVWNGGGGTNLNIDATTNWTTATTLDFNGATHAFFGNGGNTALINRAICLYGITFNRNANFTLASSSNAIALRGGGVTAVLPAATSRTYTIAENITFVDQQNWNIGSNLTGLATVEVTGSISDSVLPCGLTKTGEGTLTLKAANRYQGLTSVSNGLLAITHAQALGSTNSETLVRATQGGRLQLSGSITVAEPLTLNGERPNSGYSMISSSGSNIWSGPLMRIGQTRINTASGSTLVMTGGATGGGSLFVVNAGGTFVLAEKPALIGTTGFWTDSGGLTILAVSNNVWGDTTIGRGIVRTDVPLALPANTIVRMGLPYAAGGTLDLNGNDQTVAGLLTGTPTAGVRVVASRLPATLTINQNMASATFDGAFTGMVRLVKAGTGALTLTATNTTTAGGVVISNGSVIAASATCFGMGLVTLCAGTLHNALTNTVPLTIDRLTWQGAGQIRTTLAADGSVSRLQIVRELTRGEGTNFVFDFSGSGAPNRTYTLLTFASSSFAVNDFRYRNLGTNRYTHLCGEFQLTSQALTLRTYFPSATLMLIR